MSRLSPRGGSRSMQWLGGLVALVAVGCFSPTAVPGEPAASRARANQLYASGNYAEARGLLEALVAAGEADGPTLYRLYYCQNEAGDVAARGTLLKAREALERELESAQGLEVPFYLSNVYRNTARLSDAKRVAQEATSRIEAGKVAPPDDGLGMFQLGKLYADQERPDEARRWYGNALDSFSAAGDGLPPSAQWAARDLGQRAFGAGDWTGVEKYLGLLLDAGSATMDDYNKLAIAKVRNADYAGAQEAWRRAGNLNPAEGDHPRYCSRLAKHAVELGSLPATAPDERPWNALSPADLETLMSDRAAAAREALAAAGPREEIVGARVREINAAIGKDRAVFVRAALEYAIRGLPIRETAFRGGYAPMIFHSRQWALPPRNMRQRPAPRPPEPQKPQG